VEGGRDLQKSADLLLEDGVLCDEGRGDDLPRLVHLRGSKEGAHVGPEGGTKGEGELGLSDSSKGFLRFEGSSE
jgi:hypothetical protein